MLNIHALMQVHLHEHLLDSEFFPAVATFLNFTKYPRSALIKPTLKAILVSGSFSPHLYPSCHPLTQAHPHRAARCSAQCRVDYIEHVPA